MYNLPILTLHCCATSKKPCKIRSELRSLNTENAIRAAEPPIFYGKWIPGSTNDYLAAQAEIA